MFKSLISIDQLSKDHIETIFKLADKLQTESYQALKNETVSLLFFENSTRTSGSFEIAAKKLGAEILNFDLERSSSKKGETIDDTINNIKAFGIKYFVIRHYESGILKNLTHEIDNIHLINAGDGCNEHPSQALLDAYTLYKQFGQLDGLNITICGDILHSRVARSNIKLLSKYNCQINLVGPASILPQALLEQYQNVRLYFSLEEAIKDSDAIMALRIQQERMNKMFIPSMQDYAHLYCLNHKILEKAKPNVVIMHPGPINRGIEISSQLADDLEKSLILTQVKNGVLIRQAIFISLS